MFWVARSPIVLAFTIFALLPDPAHADAEEWVLSAEPGISLLALAPKANPSLAVDAQLSAWLGLTDTVWLFGAGGVSPRLGGSPASSEGVVGLTAALDLLRVVPFVEAGVGIFVLGERLKPSARVGLGADYLFAPDFSAGAALRYQPLLGFSEDARVTLHLRISWRGEL